MAAIGGNALNPELLASYLGAQWKQLLPTAVSTATAPIADQLEALTPRDLETLQNVSPRRKLEFSTSRSLIYGLFRELGLPLPDGLPTGAEGAPQWPGAVVGSITHCRGVCSVAIAPSSVSSMLGMDFEQLGRMRTAVWLRIASEEEIELMQQWAKTHQHTIDTAMTALFSLKESFFKAQFPVTRKYLGFLDVSVRLSDDLTFSFDAPVALPRHTTHVAITKSHVLSAVTGID